METDVIKIQVGKIYMNRTRKYLLPLVKMYGDDFVFRINSLFKVAVGIGDIAVERCGFKMETHLFLLVDSKFKPSIFNATLEKIRQHASYEDDYVYGNVVKSRFHMIVIKVPEKYIPTLQSFKDGKFSKMYSIEDVKKLFNFETRTGVDRDMYERAYKVLVHDHDYRIQFAEQIREEFDVQNFTKDDIGIDAEYDLPIKRIQEIFNMKGD